MAFTYGFYNSLSGDRKYNAIQFGSIFDGIIEDGVFQSIGEKFKVTPVSNSLAVYVGTGRAWFDHTWNLNDTELIVNLEPSNLVLPRIDAIVLEVNEKNRTNSFKAITGTSGSNPEKPAVENTQDVHQHVIAYVTVPYGAESITQGEIENRVGLEDCPFVIAPLQTVSVDQLVAQWQDQFSTWFEDLQDTLDSNAETNLLNKTNRLCPVLVKATFGITGWKSASDYGAKYTQSATVSKVYSGGGALSSSSKLIGPATCDQVSNADTRENLMEALSYINAGYISSFTGSSITVYVNEQPPCDITCYWIAQVDPNG